LETKLRQELLASLNALDKNERLKLLKKASQVRKSRQSSQKGSPTSRRQIDFDDEYEARPPIARKAASLEDIALEILATEVKAVAAFTEGSRLGKVLGVAKGRATVESEGERFDCLLESDIERRQQTALAVGDDITMEPYGDQMRIISVRPRRTSLSRPDPDAEIERVIVANVDVVVVVASVVSPPLHPRILDRFLVAIGRGGAEAAIAINKLDLLGDDRSELEEIAPYRALGIPIVPCSTATCEGISDLRDVLRGRVGAFVGHSGVGKSSLLNAMMPDLGLDTGTLMHGYGRGKHTTTASTMWDIGDETRVIDTPGIRSFGLWRLTKHELGCYFPEFVDLVCRFRNCSHTHEPWCAVREAVETGRVSGARFETYQRLLETI